MSFETETKLKEIYSYLIENNPTLKDNIFLRKADPEGGVTHIEFEDKDRTLLLYCTTLTKGIVHCRMEGNSYPGHNKNVLQ